jgi:hypothetical protein
MRGPHRLPAEFRGSRAETIGGIGLVVQARRCLWDEEHESLDEIGAGDQEWVRVNSVRRLFDGREQAEEEAIEQWCKAGIA